MACERREVGGKSAGLIARAVRSGVECQVQTGSGPLDSNGAGRSARYRVTVRGLFTGLALTEGQQEDVDPSRAKMDRLGASNDSMRLPTCCVRPLDLKDPYLPMLDDKI